MSCNQLILLRNCSQSICLQLFDLLTHHFVALALSLMQHISLLWCFSLIECELMIECALPHTNVWLCVPLWYLNWGSSYSNWMMSLKANQTLIIIWQWLVQGRFTWLCVLYPIGVYYGIDSSVSSRLASIRDALSENVFASCMSRWQMAVGMTHWWFNMCALWVSFTACYFVLIYTAIPDVWHNDVTVLLWGSFQSRCDFIILHVYLCLLLGVLFASDALHQGLDAVYSWYINHSVRAMYI